MKHRHLILPSAIALGLSAQLPAEESGASRYVPGNTATLIDLPPTKAGWAAFGGYLHYDGDASAAGNFPNAGLVTAGLDARSDALMTGGFYTFEQPVLNA
ncbi:MAG: transporter, partial [Verrucomicrobiaceae bacterium]